MGPKSWFYDSWLSLKYTHIFSGKRRTMRTRQCFLGNLPSLRCLRPKSRARFAISSSGWPRSRRFLPASKLATQNCKLLKRRLTMAPSSSAEASRVLDQMRDQILGAISTKQAEKIAEPVYYISLIFRYFDNYLYRTFQISNDTKSINRKNIVDDISRSCRTLILMCMLCTLYRLKDEKALIDYLIVMEQFIVWHLAQLHYSHPVDFLPSNLTF